jgi:hypothetical protein
MPKLNKQKQKQAQTVIVNVNTRRNRRKGGNAKRNPQQSQPNYPQPPAPTFISYNPGNVLQNPHIPIPNHAPPAHPTAPVIPANEPAPAQNHVNPLREMEDRPASVVNDRAIPTPGTASMRGSSSRASSVSSGYTGLSAFDTPITTASQSRATSRATSRAPSIQPNLNAVHEAVAQGRLRMPNEVGDHIQARRGHHRAIPRVQEQSPDRMPARRVPVQDTAMRAREPNHVIPTTANTLRNRFADIPTPPYGGSRASSRLHMSPRADDVAVGHPLPRGLTHIAEGVPVFWGNRHRTAQIAADQFVAHRQSIANRPVPNHGHVMGVPATHQGEPVFLGRNAQHNRREWESRQA